MKMTLELANNIQKMRRRFAWDFTPEDFAATIKYEGGEYVQVIDMDTLSYDADRGESYWEAIAVRLGDEIDEDGWAPIYNIIWYLDHPDKTDGDEVDDWESPSDIEANVGEIRISDGRIA